MTFKVNWSGRSLTYTKEEIDAVLKVVREADPLTQGKYLEEFEQAFAAYTGTAHCFGVTNGTHALELIADLLRLQPGDEVILPAHTYCATAIPFGRTGATLRWADIDPETFLVSLDSIKKLVTPKTKAIVVVHLYGMMCDIQAIAKFAKSKKIALVEDCAQSLGSFLKGKSCGTFGDFAAFSFHGPKNISTLGEGGMLVVKNAKLAKLVPGLRHNGTVPFRQQTDYWRPAMVNIDVDLEGVWPHNFSMSEVQAALGTVLLKRLDPLTKARRARSMAFRKQMSPFQELVFQKIEDPLTHSHHLLVARYEGRETGKTSHDLIRLLGEVYQIKTIVQYYPLYRYDLFKKMGFGKAHCPQTDQHYDNMISFPFHHWISDQDFEYLMKSTVAALTTLRKEVR